MSELKLRIDWSELDLFGHVNNVMYFKYVQAARVNYWDKSGIMKLYTSNKIGPILASTSCNFIKSLNYPGNITVKTKIKFIRNTSFGLEHDIYNDNDELVAKAEDVLVMYDYNENKKVEFPAEFRAAAEQITQE